TCCGAYAGLGVRRTVPPPNRNYSTGQTLPVAALAVTTDKRPAAPLVRDEEAIRRPRGIHGMILLLWDHQVTNAPGLRADSEEPTAILKTAVACPLRARSESDSRSTAVSRGDAFSGLHQQQDTSGCRANDLCKQGSGVRVP